MNAKLIGNIAKGITTFGVSLAIGQVIDEVAMKVYDKLSEDHDFNHIEVKDILMVVGMIIVTWTITGVLTDLATKDFNEFVDAIVEQIEASQQLVEESIE